MHYEITTSIPINNCPCCNGKATLLSDSILLDPENVVPSAFRIRCYNCSIQTKYMSSIKAVVDSWNKISPDSNSSPSAKRERNCDEESVPRSTRKAMIRLSHEAYMLFLKKNADYGNSISICGLPGVVVRLLDKLSRAAVVSQNAIQVKDETLRDTLLDISNYALMGVRLIEQGKAGDKESNHVNNSLCDNSSKYTNSQRQN